MEVNGTIFLQIVIFLTLLLWLSRFLFAPMMRLFDEREKRIHGAKDQALEMSKIADELAGQFDVEYLKARDTARLTLSELKLAMEKEHAESVEHIKMIAREK